MNKYIDFELVRKASTSHALPIVQRWLPDGRIEGCEYKARNPRRSDKNIGSFCINLRTGKWADFAAGDASGVDIISLAAYLFDLKYYDAALRLADMLNVGGVHNEKH